MNAIPDTECSLETLGADICIDDLPFFFQTGLQVRDVMTKSHVVASRQESMKSVR